MTPNALTRIVGKGKSQSYRHFQPLDLSEFFLFLKSLRLIVLMAEDLKSRGLSELPKHL